MSSEKFTCKGMEIQSVILIFRPSFVNYCPSNLISSSPYPPSLCQSTVFTDSVWLGGGWGVLSPVGDYILLEFITLYLPRFRTYKIARPPPNKNIGGEGASDR
jgi:hypothetical protein